MAVPRFIWNTLLAAISLGLAWGGRHVLHSIISNALSLIGYWTICFGLILAIETFYFRPTIGYDLEGWQDKDRMPLGLAGCFTLAAGIGVTFIGMCQTWVCFPPYLETDNADNSVTVCETDRCIRWRRGQLHRASLCGNSLSHPSQVGAQVLRPVVQVVGAACWGEFVYFNRLSSREVIE